MNDGTTMMIVYMMYQYTVGTAGGGIEEDGTGKIGHGSRRRIAVLCLRLYGHNLCVVLSVCLLRICQYRYVLSLFLLCLVICSNY